MNNLQNVNSFPYLCFTYKTEGKNRGAAFGILAMLRNVEMVFGIAILSAMSALFAKK
jgi:hypothetical protein